MTVNTSDSIRCGIASAMGAFYEGKCIPEIELLEGICTTFQAVISAIVCVLLYMNVYWYIYYPGLQPTRKLYNMIAVERSGVTKYLTKVL